MTTQQQSEILRNELNEQQWRLYLGTEALKIGYGGISQVAVQSGADWKTVQRGIKELKGERAGIEERIRQTGGRRQRRAIRACKGIWRSYWSPKGIR